MDVLHQLVLLTVGLCFFMYGLSLVSENLQILAIDQVRKLMGKIRKHPVIGVLAGVFLTFLLQSSGAVTAMLVQLASAGVVTLSQVMGVIVGSAVGSTFTVLLISFKIVNYCYYFLILGFVLLMSANKKRGKAVALVVFGFGIVFYGLLMMGDSIAKLKDVQALKELFTHISAEPIVAFTFTTIFSALVHSSAVTIGLAMTLASNGLLSLHDSMFWVFGANLGTTGTALMASMGGSYLGKQVAWAHFLYKFASVIIFLIAIYPLIEISEASSELISRQIANSHLIFNLISAVIFFPAIGLGTKIIEKLIPKPIGEKEFAPKYLSEAALNDPQLAFSNAVRELVRMAELVLSMVRLSPRLFESFDPDLFDEIRAIDKKVDMLNREIKTYLVNLTDKNLNELQSERVVGLISIVSDFEHVGDIIEKSLLELAQKMSRLKISFSPEGWEEVKELHSVVVDNFEMAISAFTLQDKKLAAEVMNTKEKLRLLEGRLKTAHIQRLHEKKTDSIHTSNMHLELLTELRKINSYVCHLVHPILYHSTNDGLFPPNSPKKGKKPN